MNILGASLLAFLACIRIAQAVRGDGLTLLLALQALVAARLLVCQRKAGTQAKLPMRLLAWVSAFLPLAMGGRPDRLWMALPGLLLMLWSLFSLGLSFDVAPADRGLVRRGPYLWLRHPMYAGEVLSLLGLCLTDMTFLSNWLLLGVFALTLGFRIRSEERLLSAAHPEYRDIPWRMIPGVW
jgi:protein-S-isoprenylcysteine O-methyltransferase Ste14